jgi:hypothetical protein
MLELDVGEDLLEGTVKKATDLVSFYICNLYVYLLNTCIYICICILYAGGHRQESHRPRKFLNIYSINIYVYKYMEYICIYIMYMYLIL